jgi:hypothetical protein
MEIKSLKFFIKKKVLMKAFYSQYAHYTFKSILGVIVNICDSQYTFECILSQSH